MKERIASKNKFGDFIDKIIEVCDDPNAPVSKEMMKAQGKIFFAAGFETTSNCLTTLCLNLAKNPDIQDKIHNEIKEVLSNHDDIINHETTQEMPYLEAAINENLRMHPPIISQERVCKKDVEVKGLKIKKGTTMRIPIHAAHHNPDYFPEPEVFKPERFLKENSEDLTPYTFLAFSGGPRICLGMRFAMTEMKVCLAKLLQKFEIKTCPKTELTMRKGDLFLYNYEEIYLTLKERN